MVWLRLIWWVFWRGLVYGALEGAVFGAVFALLAGAAYGALIGAALGGVLGLINGVSLALMTRFLFYPPRSHSSYVECVRILAVPIDGVVVAAYCLSMLSIIGIIPAFMAGITAFALSPRFADYAVAQLKHIPSRQAPATVLSRT